MNPLTEENRALLELKRLARDKRIVHQIKSGFSALRSRYHKEFRGELARLYGVAWFLREEPDAWLDFCRDPSWGSFRGRPKEKDREQALRHVIRIAVGFNGRRATNLVNKYLKRTESFFESRVSPRGAAAKILQGVQPKNKSSSTGSAETKAQPKVEYATIRIPLSDGGDTFLDLEASRIVVLLEITERKGRTRTARMTRHQTKDE